MLSENYIANNRVYFQRNFYEKSKRSVLKAKTEGPAAYVLPASDPRLGAQAELLRVLQKQGVEISRATAPFTVNLPVRRPAAGAGGGRGGAGGGAGRGAGAGAAAGAAGGRGAAAAGPGNAAAEPPQPAPTLLPAGAGAARVPLGQLHRSHGPALLAHR